MDALGKRMNSFHDNVAFTIICEAGQANFKSIYDSRITASSLHKRYS